jgi:hypothetical protein
MCPGVDSASKNEYRVNPGSKSGRCVRLTTYHLHVPMSRILGALTSRNPVGLFRPVMGHLYLFVLLFETYLHLKYYSNIRGMIVAGGKPKLLPVFFVNERTKTQR